MSLFLDPYEKLADCFPTLTSFPSAYLRLDWSWTFESGSLWVGLFFRVFVCWDIVCFHLPSRR
jgi:hypothetical protein